ncbi:hypothetical protein BH09ACT7_BH09ACT7_18300 [soil metagenome]
MSACDYGAWAKPKSAQRGSLPISALTFYVLAHWPEDTLRRSNIRHLLPRGERRKIGGRNRNNVREAIRLADQAAAVDRDGDLIRVRCRPELLVWALDVAQADERHPQLVAIRRAIDAAEMERPTGDDAGRLINNSPTTTKGTR